MTGFLARSLPLVGDGGLRIGDLVCTVTDECRNDAIIQLYPPDSPYDGDAVCADHLDLVEIIGALDEEPR